jgi:hypothetical protein
MRESLIKLHDYVYVGAFMKERTAINDSWVLSRAGYFSNSFSDFLSQLALKMPDGERKEVEKAARILGPKGVDELDIPSWIKPFASKIIQNVRASADKIHQEITDDLFGTGIFSLSDALYNVARERGVTNEAVLHLIRMLPEFEALMYFLNVRKYYRDHCAHQLRVAVLGDFLLDLKSEAGNIEGIIKDKLGLSSEEVRTAWWFTGLLHDTGIPLAKLCTAINWSMLNEILRCYQQLDIKASPMFVSLAGDELQNREYLSILTDNRPKRWQEMIKRGLGVYRSTNKSILFEAGYYANQEYQAENLRMDHGVVGAINLLRTLGSPDKIRKRSPEDTPLIEAARAISVHNFKEGLRNVRFEESPLAFLLILVDELQEWSRPVPVPVKDTYFTTNLEKIALLDAIFYTQLNELWDIPYGNTQAKKIAKFDFKKLCVDKTNALKVLDCAERFPESEVRLRNINTEKPRKEEKFNIKIETR